MENVDKHSKREVGFPALAWGKVCLNPTFKEEGTITTQLTSQMGAYAGATQESSSSTNGTRTKWSWLRQVKPAASFHLATCP